MAYPQVGFMGLGRMGTAMAVNLAEAGIPLVVYNRTIAKAKAFAERHGTAVADTPAELAEEAEVLISMLADGPALRAVYEGQDGVLAGLGPGRVAVDMGTVGPTVIRQLGERLRAAGSAMVDAPVSGSVSTAEAAKLLIMAGGEAEDVERVRPILELLGDPVLHLGPLGAGATVKLAVNSIVHGLNQALSEALVLAERAGVDRSAAYEVFARSAVGAPVVRYRRPVYERPGETPVTFTIDLAAKDLQLALELAERVGAAMPQARGNLRILEEASRAGYGERDMGDVAVYVREVLSDA